MGEKDETELVAADKNDTTKTPTNGKAGSSEAPGEETPLKDGYDPSHKGPKRKRSCTDIICCIIFLVFIAGQVIVAYFAYVQGDPELLIYPQDSEGNLCGLGKYENRTKLFFFDLVKCGRMGPGVFVNGCPTPQVCVKSCPKTNFVYLQSTVSNDKSQLICKDGVDKSTKTVKQLIEDEDCAAYYLDSKSVINRCLPISALLDLGNDFVAVNTSEGYFNVTEADDNPVKGEFLKTGLVFYEQFLKAKEFGEKIVADVVASWWMILIGLGIAMLISLIWIVLMRWIAGFMVWLTILAFVALWLGATIFCWYYYYDVKGKDETLTLYLVWQMTFSKEKLFLAGGIIFGVIFVIVFLILLFLCQRIRIAVALIKQGSRAVGTMMSSLLWPLAPFIMQLGVVALWGSVATYLASVGREPDPEDNNITYANGSTNYEAVKRRSSGLFINVTCDEDDTQLGKLCGYIKYGKGDYTIYLQIYNLFMLFWLVNFVVAVGQLTLSGAFASYYWAYNKPKDIPTFPILVAFYRCFRYHLGSLAFGSLLIAIVQLIRAFLEYLDGKLKGSENPVAKFFLKCLKCCFWCLEKFLRFITKNAYIMMAVHGKNFCTSAADAFNLILRNVVRVFVLDKVTDFLLFVCKLVVVGATGVIAFFFFDGRIDYLNEYRPTLNFYIVPIVIVILGSYIIADVFFSVYEMAVDTLFLCFLEDLEKNDGSPEKPYFMTKELRKLLGKKNIQPKPAEGK